TAAPLPEAAVRLRANRARLARLALEATLRLAPSFSQRYDETGLRLFLRDYDRHIEQLARSLETGNERFLMNYAEWIVPVYRRRRVPMRDFMALLAGLQEVAGTVLTPDERVAAAHYVARAAHVLKHHGRLPGDHKGNPIVRFFWKGAGILDDEIV
ncbi:MAG TPA: hypothetical protein VK992_06155, partial [Candidatus Caenarcaniphilales bacterium]|nr:hypothetical protein [Candidatus Caenarcaniphilales bacterium]